VSRLPFVRRLLLALDLLPILLFELLWTSHEAELLQSAGQLVRAHLRGQKVSSLPAHLLLKTTVTYCSLSRMMHFCTTTFNSHSDLQCSSVLDLALSHNSAVHLCHQLNNHRGLMMHSRDCLGGMQVVSDRGLMLLTCTDSKDSTSINFYNPRPIHQIHTCSQSPKLKPTEKDPIYWTCLDSWAAIDFLVLVIFVFLYGDSCLIVPCGT
jgi:hypothetical protein